MKNISLKTIVIIGAVFMIITGSLLHFIYAWSGNNQIVALFSATSESVWEHNKLFLLPLAVVAFVEYLKVKDLSKILLASLVQLMFMMGFIIVFFYTYTGAFGFENVVIDILSFMVAVVLGQVITYKKLNSKSKLTVNKYISGTALLVIFVAFAFITFNPPQLPIFTPHAPTTETQK